MKPNKTCLGHGLAVLLTTTWALAAVPAFGENATPLPHAVSFELGDSQFALGDSITIQKLSGTSDMITTGGTYCVEGTYVLDSHDSADLSFFATVNDATPTPIDPAQTVRVTKGAGTFRLTKTVTEAGYLHVSFYAGNSFGGIYFGQGNWVLHNGDYSQFAGQTRHNHPSTTSGGKPTLAGPNRALLEYLGNPVEPLADMDARYTAQGLTDAVQRAASNAGIKVKKVTIEDSEFPFLVGVICEGSDFIKLKGELARLDGYNFAGGIGNDRNSDGSDTCNVVNIVPYQADPPETYQRVYHRLGLRQQVFYDKINSR